jgi:hypothetical protein
MSRSPDEQVEEPEAEGNVRGGTRWGVVLGILVLPTLVAAGALVLLGLWLFTDDSVSTGVAEAPCKQALAYGGAKVPKGAYDTLCEVRSDSNTRYTASFRMPSDEVGGWLTTTYPGAPEPRDRHCSESVIDRCLDLDPGDIFGVDAAVRLEFRDDGPGWTQVRFSASSV